MKKTFVIICAALLSVNLYSQTQLWGVSTFGGNQYGTIYSFATGSTVMASQFNLTGSHMGEAPYGEMILASNGKMYGMTQSGGSHGYGTIFEYDPITGGYDKKYDLAKATGGLPLGNLIEVANGIFYGMTAWGGANDLGTIFEYNLNTNVYTKKIDFDGFGKGSNPFGSLLKASNGKLYGFASEGGAQYAGTLFELDITTNSFQKKVDFAGSSANPNNAGTPRGHFIQASNSKLYGLSYDGGNQANGAIFEYDIIADTCITVFNFDGATHGKYPYGSLMQASNGKLYGTTHEGGIANGGVIFEFDLLSHTCNNKFNFYTNAGDPGVHPFGNLVQAPDGNLYGMTEGGGANYSGALYKFNPTSGAYSRMFSFNSTSGMAPHGSLINGPGNKLYGMTRSGGVSNSGVLFDYNPATNVYTKKFDFSDAIDGQYPQGALTKASNGKFYGMTNSGGAHNGGTLYEFDPLTQAYVKKIDFLDSLGGTYPVGSLIEALPGKLYGVTTTNGGSAFMGNGVIFEYDMSTNTLIEKFVFPNNGQIGFNPCGALLKASNGKLYGTTSGGGINNQGTLYEYDLSTAAVTTLTNFAGFNGQSISSPIEAPNGKLYGLAGGIAYSYDPTTTTYTLVSAVGATSGTRTGPLTLAANGKMYGMTTDGGVNSKGTILLCNPATNSYYKVADFNNMGVFPGASPHGAMTLAPDGNLYGVTTEGGLYNQGIIFKFDPSTNSLSKVLDFNGLNGRSPYYTQLLGPCQTAGLSINGPDHLCSGSGQSVFYNVPLVPGFTYTWTTIPGVLISPNNNSNNISLNLSGLSSGIYTLSVSSTNACSITLSSSLTLTVNPASSLPTISISGNTNVCEGSSTTFTATGVNTYTWNEGTTNAVFQTIPVSNTTYSVMGEDLNACVVTATVSVTVDNTCADIWPGDANSDGIANNLDVLELGLHYTQTGSPRASTSNNWQSYFANNWTGIISNGKNLNHSDCNGDGIINDDDTLAIYSNYGLIHTFKIAQTTTVNAQLSIVPDQATVGKGVWGTASVYLGDASHIINNVNGIAFTIDFNSYQIESNGIWIEYQNSFMDASQNLHFQKVDFINGKLFTATTHTINNNVSGFGKIATLHYQISSSLFSDQLMTLSLSQVYQSNASGVISPLTSSAGTLMAMGYTAGINENNFSGNVMISPNPTNGILNIGFSSIPQNTKIELYNSIGALVLTEVMSNKNNTININDLCSGMYFMKMLEGNRVVVVKKVVKE